MINRIVINKNQLSKKPIGKVIKTEKDFYDTRFKNIVIGYIGEESILIKTNLTQEQFNLFVEGKLSRKELKNIFS